MPNTRYACSLLVPDPVPLERLMEKVELNSKYDMSIYSAAWKH